MYTYDLSRGESLSDGVVQAVAAASSAEPVPTTGADEALDPLYTVVDPDALDAVFRDRACGRVTFSYHGYEVTADGRGRVAVDRPDSVGGAAD